MGLLSSTWEAIKSTCQSILDAIFGRREDWQEKYDAQQDITQRAYSPEEPDIVLHHKCIEYINSKFPYGVEYYINNSSVDERMECLRKMTEELSLIYDVSLNGVILYTPENESDNRTGGFYDSSDNTIHLNVSFLFYENQAWVTEMFLTVFHELKHARQWAAIQNWKDYGYSNELLYSWNMNWLPGNYILPEESDEGYRKQPIEFDAFAFMEQLRSSLST